MIDFLFEIGFEEFPPSYLPKAAADLAAGIEALLKKEKIFHRTVRPVYTSRRLALVVLGLAKKQKPQTIEVQGPPAKLAFDQNGEPTETLIGFMKTHGLKREEIKTVKTEKGEYIKGTRQTAARTTEEILTVGIPPIVAALEFTKTMVWNDTRFRFPRPIRWVVALLDRKPLKLKIAGIAADRYSMPNLHFSFDPIRLEKPRFYLTELRHGGVVLYPNERKKLILKQVSDLAKKLNGEPVFDDAMIEEANCVIEYPDVVAGAFDEQFLKLPPELLTTTLKALGNLIWIRDTNRFICVFSAKRKAADNIGAGYGKVLRSRLYDAHFYYQADLRLGIDRMREQTRDMVWMQDLGTVYDKSSRLVKFVSRLGLEIDASTRAAVEESAALCKADLVSSMVREKEFTALQGIMGSYYAAAAGKDPKVVTALREHYQPRFAGDRLPSTREGAILAVADKIDNVVGAFFGHKPTGSYDPLAARRHGYAVANILDVFGLNLPLYDAVKESIENCYPAGFAERVAHGAVCEFFAERIDRYLQDKGLRYDEIKSVLNTSRGNVYDIRLRCEAIKNYRNKADFAKLVIGQKRVRNILKGTTGTEPVATALFAETAEKELFELGRQTGDRIEPLLRSHDYGRVLDALLDMRPAIDAFFDAVMVMCDDKALRSNRLALVGSINRLFLAFADLSQIVIADTKKS